MQHLERGKNISDSFWTANKKLEFILFFSDFIVEVMELGWDWIVTES